MNDNNTLLKFTGFFKWLSIILFLLSIFVFIVTIKDEWSYPPQVDSIGINNLFTKFNTTIKTFTYFLGTLAIWLTLSRMFQTKQQIELIESNNRFNNFFKHRVEFINQFKQNPFFKEYELLSKENPEIDLMNLYSLFYYKSHYNFTPFLNNNYSLIIEKFLSAVQSSSLNNENMDLNGMGKDEIKAIEKLNEPQIRKFTTYMNSNLTFNIRKLLEEKKRENISETIQKFPDLNEIYWTAILYKSLKAFDGDDNFHCDNFVKNYSNYQIDIFYDWAKVKNINIA